jgi:hypothetical protein
MSIQHANIRNVPTCMKFARTPAQIVEQLKPVDEAGFDYFLIATGTSLENFTALKLLSHEVLPALNKGH